MFKVREIKYRTNKKRVDKWLEMTAKHAPGLNLPLLKGGLLSQTPYLLPFVCQWKNREVGGFVLEFLPNEDIHTASFVAMYKTGDLPPGMSMLDLTLNSLEEAWAEAGLRVEIRGMTIQENVMKILSSRGWMPRHTEYVLQFDPYKKAEVA